MARTQSPDYDKRRDAILTQAARLYARRGFLGASIADLAKACKASKSLVYHYYPSKEDILYGVMNAHLEELVEVAGEVMALPDLGPADRLRTLTTEFMQIYAGAAASHKVLLNELENLPADKRRAVITRQREVVDLVERLLLELRPDLAEHPDLKRPISMLFFGMINWTHTWFKPRGPVSPKELALVAVDMLLSGLGGIPLGIQPS
jgi:AcrR family transcriptional regulator